MTEKIEARGYVHPEVLVPTDWVEQHLNDPSVRLGPATRRSDVDGWDSFKYVTFIVAVEADLGIRFSVADVESFATVGDIVAEVRRLLG